MLKTFCVLLSLAALACGETRTNPGSPDGGPTGDGPVNLPDAFAGPFSDFPTAPYLDNGVPSTIPGMFGQTGNPTGGPCLVEPEPGSVFPRNWLRPRFRVLPLQGQQIYEIRLHADNEVNDLVAYTTSPTWTLPLDVWVKLTMHIIDAPITMTVRSAPWDGTMLTGAPSTGTMGSFTIAPVVAPGAIVYWTTTNGTALRGFPIGAETVQDVLRPAQAGAGVLCVGCHSSTPDGAFVGFSASSQAGNGDPSQIGLRSVNGQATVPSYISSTAQALMARVPQQLPSFSRAHFSSGDRVMLAMIPVNNQFEIGWIDLETSSTMQGQGWGIVARSDGHAAASATFEHAGTKVLYVSASSVASGVTVTDGDIYTVPWNNRAGGTSTAVAGASDSAYNEYYPTFSPDDRLIAFNRIPTGQRSYNNANAEVFVVPAAGGPGTTATRLPANDPPACTGQMSPGVTNSWPKWAPEATVGGNKTYYWLTFSSTRELQRPQLYVSPVIIDETGAIHGAPALYLWNQPQAEANHTPAWDVFMIQ